MYSLNLTIDFRSCIAAFMPGCKFGPESGGGVMKRREERAEKQRLEAETRKNEGEEGTLGVA